MTTTGPTIHTPRRAARPPRRAVLAGGLALAGALLALAGEAAAQTTLTGPRGGSATVERGIETVTRAGPGGNTLEVPVRQRRQSWTGPNGGTAESTAACGPFGRRCGRRWTATGPEGRTASGGAWRRPGVGGPVRGRALTGPGGDARIIRRRR
jgi:hypothetical protein